MTNFKIQGVGIDTTSILVKPWKEDDGEIYDYIHTSISANNDFLISDYTKSQPGAPLITTIDFINNPERAILGHLLELGREKVNLLLVSATALENNLGIITEIIEGLKTSGVIEEFGISCPTSVDQIKKIEEAYGDKIKFISLNLCPLNFDYDIVEYTKENNIDILSFNPFGGYISAPSVISSFTVPYLLGFSSTYATVMFLSGRDLLSSLSSRNYIREYIVGKETSTKYVLKKSISKLSKPLKKVVNTSLIMNDLVIPYNIPTLMYPPEEIKMVLGKTETNIPEKEKSSGIGTETSVEESVYNLLGITEFPSDISLEDRYAITRYQVLGVIRTTYPKSQGWEINMINLGDKTLGIGVVRKVSKKMGLLKKKKEEEFNYFLLSVIDENTTLFLENPDSRNTATEG